VSPAPRPRLRRARLSDLETLVRHRRLMWRDIGGYTAADLAAADPVFRRWARTRLRSGALFGWVVEVGGEPAASGCVWLQEGQPRPRAPQGIQPYLLSVYTDPEHRGRGLATRILKVATQWVKRAKLPRFTLHASPMGRSLYRAHGWERTWEMKIDLPAPRLRS
jgi:GNAT superfamily N-acetyltransferase